MSPTNPISPLSPMDLSPTTPCAGSPRFIMPPTPTLAASMHLPRLVTSFQNTGNNASSAKRMSIQFQLSTPSPLTLGQTPLTNVPRRSFITSHKRSVALSPRSDCATRGTPVSPLAAVPTPYSRQPRGNELPSCSPSACRKVPMLQRKNAIEGLEDMQLDLFAGSPIVGQVMRLSLRLNTRSSTGALQVSSEPQRLPASQPSADSQIPSISTLRPPVPRSTSQTKRSARAAQLKPHSPIHKRRTSHRRHVSHSFPTRIVVRRSQTPQQKYLQSIIAHLGNQLIPLISVTTGLSHPNFPTTLLQYNLLTHDQLDDLVRWYHQTIDADRQRWMYPCPIAFGKVWCGSTPSSDTTQTVSDPARRHLVDLETKRRRWGRFIGLRGCESPIMETGCESESGNETGENVTQRMEREWREAMRRAEEEARVREKMWRGRF